MSAMEATTRVKLIRRAAALAAVGLAVFIAFRSGSRWRRRPEPASPPLAEAKVDRKEAVRHEEFKDGRLQDEIRADRLYLGSDGLNHLEGSVDILDHGNAPDRETEIHADAVAYDKDLTRFMMSGNVRIRARDANLACPDIIYDRNAGRFSTDSGGSFSTPRLTGTARSVTYDDAAGEVMLSGGFLVEIKEAAGPAESARIEGDALSYSRSTNVGRVDGRAHVTRRGMEAWAERLAFKAAPDEASFSEMSFEGAARCVLGPGGEQQPGSEGPTAGRRIEAGTLRVRWRPGTTGPSSVEARDGVLLVLAASGDPGLSVSSETAVLAFVVSGELERADASDAVKMDLDGKPDEPKRIEAPAVRYDASAGTVWAGAPAGTPQGGGRVAVESSRFRVEASSFTLDTVRRSFDAQGPAVRCVLEPAESGKAPAFFSGEERVLVTSGGLASTGRGASPRLLFTGGARAWQGTRSIRAAELEIDLESGEAGGRGGVVVSLARASSARGGARETIEVGARDMQSLPEERLLVFRGNGSIRLAAASLSGETVSVGVGAEDGTVASISAKGGVVVRKGDYEGRGEEARYDPREDTIVLTGTPILTAKDKGISRGTRLTFHLGDGRILIENDGQGRSATIVKS